MERHFACPTVALAPPDLLLSTGTAWLEIDVSSTYTAQTANNIAFTCCELGNQCSGCVEEVSNECRDVEITGGVLDVDRWHEHSFLHKGRFNCGERNYNAEQAWCRHKRFHFSANSSTTTGLEWIANQVGTVTSVSVNAPLGVTNGTKTPALTISTGTTSAVGVLQLTDGVASSSTTTAATPNGVKTAYDLAALAMPKAGGIFAHCGSCWQHWFSRVRGSNGRCL